ncbi:preprotein translocase subunit SecE [[Mycoplasma] testudinis]|uniref:preprotein translocase subunit SecE n=1 Tax=[Mycoplasma] testudinis TaxID=33924 RepID=UPI0006964539|nr:preprotein translocase subunit SecE [[Mycoplasma] testudinis]
MENIFDSETKPTTPAPSGGINLRQGNKKVKLSDYQDNEIHQQHRSMRDRVVSKKIQEKKDNKKSEPDLTPKEKIGFGFRLKRWWFGMSKESRRISWATPKNLVISFIIVVVAIAVLTGIFYGINEIFVSAGILK